jgi:hypothetical protein
MFSQTHNALRSNAKWEFQLCVNSEPQRALNITSDNSSTEVFRLLLRYLFFFYQFYIWYNILLDQDNPVPELTNCYVDMCIIISYNQKNSHLIVGTCIFFLFFVLNKVRGLFSHTRPIYPPSNNRSKLTRAILFYFLILPSS